MFCFWSSLSSILKRFPPFLADVPWIFFHPLLLYCLLPYEIPPFRYSYLQLDELPFELVSVRLTSKRNASLEIPFCDIHLISSLPPDNNTAILPLSDEGIWRPKGCLPNFEIALVIPYRDRAAQLDSFLKYMHRFLQSQHLAYRIVIVEQTNSAPFNRGKLFNIGYNETEKIKPCPCYIFHDVDLLPEDLANVYACTHQPRHLSVAVNTMRYVLPYSEIFGGVTAITSHVFQRLNGYANSLYGWGGEDDDMSLQLRSKGFHIVRLDPKHSRYSMMMHPKAESVPGRYVQISHWHETMAPHRTQDGLRSLSYNVVKKELRPLYTWILVDA